MKLLELVGCSNPGFSYTLNTLYNIIELIDWINDNRNIEPISYQAMQESISKRQGNLDGSAIRMIVPFFRKAGLVNNSNFQTKKQLIEIKTFFTYTGECFAEFLKIYVKYKDIEDATINIILNSIYEKFGLIQYSNLIENSEPIYGAIISFLDKFTTMNKKEFFILTTFLNDGANIETSNKLSKSIEDLRSGKICEEINIIKHRNAYAYIIPFLKEYHIVLENENGIYLNKKFNDFFDKIRVGERIMSQVENDILTDIYKEVIDLKRILESRKDINKDNKRIVGGSNILLYGLPGCGKSHTIKEFYCQDEERMERVVFHPDYTYSDFIGQIIPRIEKIDGEEKLNYKFINGPFTSILKKAYKDQYNMYYLVIEEINRGNAPAIFGEVFQLLDRNDAGESIYGITNYEIAQAVYNDENTKVKIPSNFTLLATMNTADQNVFTLDTAFKRRWNMQLIRNKFDNPVQDKALILDTNIEWGKFVKIINKKIVNSLSDIGSSEDKRLGEYFMKVEEFQFKNDSNENEKQKLIEGFAEKVIMYLWNDVFKYNKDTIFNNNYNTLEEIIDAFEKENKNERFKIFKDSIFMELENYKLEDKNTEAKLSPKEDIIFGEEINE